MYMDLYEIHMGLEIFQPLSLFICRLGKPENRKTLTYKCVWFGGGPQWRKNLYRENVGF